MARLQLISGLETASFSSGTGLPRTPSRPSVRPRHAAVSHRLQTAPPCLCNCKLVPPSSKSKINNDDQSASVSFRPHHFRCACYSCPQDRLDTRFLDRAPLERASSVSIFLPQIDSIGWRGRGFLVQLDFYRLFLSANAARLVYL